MAAAVRCWVSLALVVRRRAGSRAEGVACGRAAVLQRTLCRPDACVVWTSMADAFDAQHEFAHDVRVDFELVRHQARCAGAVGQKRLRAAARAGR